MKSEIQILRFYLVGQIYFHVISTNSRQEQYDLKVCKIKVEKDCFIRVT